MAHGSQMLIEEWNGHTNQASAKSLELYRLDWFMKWQKHFIQRLPRVGLIIFLQLPLFLVMLYFPAGPSPYSPLDLLVLVVAPNDLVGLVLEVKGRGSPGILDEGGQFSVLQS